jgi:hypothetical protein
MEKRLQDDSLTNSLTDEDSKEKKRDEDDISKNSIRRG